MSLEENEDFLKVSFSKIFLKFSTGIVMGALTLNGWFIMRLVSSIDSNEVTTQMHSVRIATLESKLDTLIQRRSCKNSRH